MQKSEIMILALAVTAIGLTIVIDKYYFNRDAHILEIKDPESLADMRYNSVVAVLMLAPSYPSLIFAECTTDPFWRSVLLGLSAIRDNQSIGEFPFLKRSYLGYRDTAKLIASGQHAAIDTTFVKTMIRLGSV